MLADRVRTLRSASNFGPNFELPPRRGSRKLRAVPDTIEAEVLEIDGSPPPAPGPQEPQSRQGAGAAWDSLRGKVIRFDRRWWPLWVLLGILALALLLTVGVVIAVFVVVAKLLGGILRFLTGGSPSRSGNDLSRRSF